jgi:hypothetical protein
MFEELLTGFWYGLLIFFVFKMGQISVYAKHQTIFERQATTTERPTVIKSKPLITVEEINGTYYAYDGDDFLAQGNDPDELSAKIASRFPQKYVGARVQLRT